MLLLPSSFAQVLPGEEEEEPVDNVPEDGQGEWTHKGVGLEAAVAAV